MTTMLASDPVVALLVRGAFALLFASAAWHKLGDRRAFASVLAAYRVLPASAVSMAAVLIAALEGAVALAWVAPGLGTMAAGGAVVLLAIYSLAIAVNLVRGRRTIDCGCGILGARQPISEWLIVRNLLLTVVALTTLGPGTGRALVWIDAVTLLGGLVVVSSVWMAAHRLAVASQRVPSIERPR
jgi:hypothetical protein